MNTVNEPLYTDSEKLDRFVKAVNSEVDKEIAKIISEADASKKEIIDFANDEALGAAYNLIQESIKKVSSKYVKIVAKAELECKKDILIKRENLTKSVFDNIKECLVTFREKPQYLKYLISLAKTEKITENVTICLRSDDMKYSDDIQKALEIPVQFTEDSTIKLGGLSILYPEQGVMIDKTIDTALSEQREIFNGKNCFSQS